MVILRERKNTEKDSRNIIDDAPTKKKENKNMRTCVRGTGIKTKGWRVGRKPFGRACAGEALFSPEKFGFARFCFYLCSRINSLRIK